MLIKAFGEHDWDLTDPTKKKSMKELKGGLVCFCNVMSEAVQILTKDQLAKVKEFKDEPFAKNGCEKIS